MVCKNKPWQTAVPGTVNTPNGLRLTSAIWERGGKAAGLPVRGGGLPSLGLDQGPRHTLVHAQRRAFVNQHKGTDFHS